MKLKKILFKFGLPVAILAIVGIGYASASVIQGYGGKDSTVNICRENKDGEWSVISISKNDEIPGDFAYGGPTNRDGSPSEDGGQWCKENEPVFACNSLNVVENASPGSVTATVTDTATNGATVSYITFDFGDGTTPDTSLATTDNHTYASNGTYNVKTTIGFEVNGLTETASCDPVVAVVGNILAPTPAVTPATPAVSTPATTTTTSSPEQATPGTS